MLTTRILFAHSDLKLVELYRYYLKQLFTFDSAHDGLTAIRKLKIAPAKLIISDYDLPLLSGLSLLKFVRSSPSLFAVPFIFLTDKELSLEALSFGANEWILKAEAYPNLMIDKALKHLKSNREYITHI